MVITKRRNIFMILSPTRFLTTQQTLRLIKCKHNWVHSSHSVFVCCIYVLILIYTMINVEGGPSSGASWRCAWSKYSKHTAMHSHSFLNKLNGSDITRSLPAFWTRCFARASASKTTNLSKNSAHTDSTRYLGLDENVSDHYDQFVLCNRAVRL